MEISAGRALGEGCGRFVVAFRDESLVVHVFEDEEVCGGKMLAGTVAGGSAGEVLLALGRAGWCERDGDRDWNKCRPGRKYGVFMASPWLTSSSIWSRICVILACQFACGSLASSKTTSSQTTTTSKSVFRSVSVVTEKV